MTDGKIDIILIEDEKLVRESLLTLIDRHPLFHPLGAFHNVEALLEEQFIKEPEIILLDINLVGGISGIEGISPIKSKFTEVDVIMLTTFDDQDRIFKSLCAGASAYITKRTSFPKIAEAIQSVHRGGSYMSPSIARKVVEYFNPKSKKNELTPRQIQVVEGIIEGLSYKLIADRLLISAETVRDHIKKIYRKLEIHSKAELIKKRMNKEI